MSNGIFGCHECFLQFNCSYIFSLPYKLRFYSTLHSLSIFNSIYFYSNYFEHNSTLLIFNGLSLAYFSKQNNFYSSLLIKNYVQYMKLHKLLAKFIIKAQAIYTIFLTTRHIMKLVINNNFVDNFFFCANKREFQHFSQKI